MADQDPSIADDEGIDWPVVMGYGEFVGGGDHLLSESEGHCWSQDSVSFFSFSVFYLVVFHSSVCVLAQDLLPRKGILGVTVVSLPEYLVKK